VAEKPDCIFCKIASGELPYYKVYEDQDVIAMLDIRPVNRGHALVIPKRHFENVHDLPDNLLAKIAIVAKRVAAAQKKALQPPGISVVQNNGAAAGQVIFHYHMHVIPKDHDLHQRSDPTSEELTAMAEALRRSF
jgi:histidine triad (HIT) family protein